MKTDRNIRDLIEEEIIKDSRVFAICGSGGKTSLLRLCCRSFSGTYQTAAAASTAIGFPDGSFSPSGRSPLVITPEGAFKLEEGTVRSLPEVSLEDRRGEPCFYGDMITEVPKLHGLDQEMFAMALSQNQLLFIEADGSARRPLKGWRDNEPVVPEGTDVTIGILPVHLLGKVLKAEDIHRPEFFRRLTGKGAGDLLTLEDLRKLAGEPQGLFKCARGRRLLLLNRISELPEGVSRECLTDALKETADLIVTADLAHEIC